MGAGSSRCEPADQCQYRYRFLDATFGESCRLMGDKKHVKPIYKTKIMAHPVRTSPPGPEAVRLPSSSLMTCLAA